MAEISRQRKEPAGWLLRWEDEPMPRSALEKALRPGPLFEGNPVGEGTPLKQI